MLSAFTITMCFDTPSITLCIYIFVLNLKFFIFRQYAAVRILAERFLTLQESNFL